jgi:hypothetical protein
VLARPIIDQRVVDHDEAAEGAALRSPFTAIVHVALSPKAAAEHLDAVWAQPRLLGQDTPARAHHAGIWIDRSAEPSAHRVRVEADAPRLEVLLGEWIARAKLVRGTGRTRVAGAH